MRDAPAWPCIMILDSARWAATHRVTSVESVDGGLLLRADDGAAHRVHWSIGLELADGADSGCVTLAYAERNHVDGILDWEASHPSERPVGSSEASLRHLAWSAARRLGPPALAAIASDELAAALAGRTGILVRPAGTAPARSPEGVVVMTATVGSHPSRRADGDVAITLLGRVAGGAVEWMLAEPDPGVGDAAAIVARVDALPADEAQPA